MRVEYNRGVNILQKIEDMKGRSKDERVALAGSIAVAVVIILFLGWAVFFVRSAKSSLSVPVAQEAGTSSAQDQSPTLFDQSAADQGAEVQLNDTGTPPAY